MHFLQTVAALAEVVLVGILSSCFAFLTHTAVK
jgi:hypothetical protein